MQQYRTPHYFFSILSNPVDLLESTTTGRHGDFGPGVSVPLLAQSKSLLIRFRAHNVFEGVLQQKITLYFVRAFKGDKISETRLMLHASRTRAYAPCPTKQGTSFILLILQPPPGKDAGVASKSVSRDAALGSEKKKKIPPHSQNVPNSIVERLLQVRRFVSSDKYMCIRIIEPLACSRRGAPEVPEPLTLGAKYLTRYHNWKILFPTTRPAL